MLDRNEKLTTHFRFGAFLVSKDYPELAAALTPSGIHTNNLFLLCATILEPVRMETSIGPIIILSGYRDIFLNDAVGGATNSLHRFGKAADITPEDLGSIHLLFAVLQHMVPHAWTQLIWYKKKNFIHVALPHPGIPRMLEIKDR